MREAEVCEGFYLSKGVRKAPLSRWHLSKALMAKRNQVGLHHSRQRRSKFKGPELRMSLLCVRTERMALCLRQRE